MDSLLLALRVALSLACVLGLMWFAQRRLGRARTRRHGELQVVARQNLGGKAQVVLLETAGSRFLLGVTEHQVSVLHTTDAPAQPVFEASLARAADDAADEPTLLPVNALEPAKGWAAGSLLDAGTWKAAAAAVTGRNRAA
ncbi:flagellar biosynthetic protein FliO [Occultella aeris]|uniref:Flagellar protein FliO n=1 Tax=Occultella aeris TaxID=2761496 RepID=A0A7M4DDF9_9MICO|nr:flagellar biosynthetic protein FliO [Occultella aeris]VZO34878.1 Flagellar protein FliO [Occultella aeris]